MHRIDSCVKSVIFCLASPYNKKHWTARKISLQSFVKNVINMLGCVHMYDTRDPRIIKKMNKT